jgi:transcriptional regulator with XRE-family HTH domain
MSQYGMARVAGVDARTIARWEKDGRPPYAAEKLIRLVYLSTITASAPLKASIESIDATRPASILEFVLRERRGAWSVESREPAEA